MTALVEAELGGNFNYTQLDVDWSKFKPTIFLQDAEWRNEKGTVELSAGKGLFVVNFWESLFKGYLVTEKIELNSVNLDIDLSQKLVTGNNYSFNIELLLKRYPEVINQERVQIRNLSLNLKKKQQKKKVQVAQLSFRKRDQHRQLVVDFQSEFASQGKLIAESEGMPFSDHSAVTIYGLLRDFDLVDSSQFFELPQGIPVELADTEFWLSYEDDFPVSGRLLFQADSVESQVAQLDAEINYLHEGQRTIFSSDKFHVVERSESGDLKQYNSYFKVIRDGADADNTLWRLEAENTPIGYFTSLSIPFLPKELRQQLSALSPEGDLVSLDIEARQSAKQLVPIGGSAAVTDFSVQATEHSPGIALKRVRLHKYQDGWSVIANAEDSTIHWPGVFKNDIPVDTLLVDAWVSFKEKPFISINQFTLDNPDTHVLANGNIEVTEDDVEVSLYAEAREINIAALESYWPRNRMKEDALSFLDQALVGGTVDFAKLIWRGNIENFPYEQHDGQFDIQAKVSDSQFKFDSEWPKVAGLSANVHFENNRLLLQATQGRVLGVDIGQVDGVIESLFTKGSILTLQVDNQVEYQPYRNLFLASPLQQWLGEELLQLRFTGKLDHNLDLKIALSDDSDEIHLNGEVNFKGQNLTLSSYPLGLERLQGNLYYTERGAYSQELKAQLWQSPIDLDITVDDYTKNDDLVNINAQSMFDLAKAMASFEVQLPIKVEGQSPVNLHYRKDAEGAVSMIVRSDLQGTLIDGPSWLSKTKDNATSFLTTLYKTNGRIHSRTIYRDTISAQLDFGVDTPQDINGVIAMGELATSSITVPQRGVAIEGFFPEIHSYEWINSLQVKKEGDFYWPKWIDHIAVKAALFTVAGQSLHDVTLTDSLLDDDSVRFNVTAREGHGSLTLFPDGRKHVTINRLDIELQPFSRLAESEIELGKEALDKWQLECLSCQINGIDTGQLTLISRLQNGGVMLKGDSQIEGQLDAYLEGLWQGNQSAVNIRFTTDDTGALLKRWGYGDGLKATKAVGSIALSWPGGFHDISLDKLDGKISLDTEEGAVKELSDRQARVFSLFSLQSIRRRLSLDFSDLFEDGFFYDKMHGAFTIENGVVHSDDVFIDGTAADVRIKGSTDLVKQTVDQNVTVVPKLGASLPVLAGWAIEPTTGLIMLIVNKIFEPVMDVVVSIEYKVSGDLANPAVVELSKKSKEVKVPESEVENKPQQPVEEKSQPATESPSKLEDNNE